MHPPRTLRVALLALLLTALVPAAPSAPADAPALTLEWRPPSSTEPREPPTLEALLGRERGPDPRLQAPLVPAFTRGNASYFFLVPANFGRETFDGHFVVRVPEAGLEDRARMILDPVLGQFPGLQNGFVIGSLWTKDGFPSPFTLEFSFELLDGTRVGQRWTHEFEVLDRKPCQDHAGLLSAFASRDVLPVQQYESYALSLCNETPHRPLGALSLLDGATGRPIASGIGVYYLAMDSVFYATDDRAFSGPYLWTAPERGIWTGAIFAIDTASPPGPVSPTLRIAWDDGVLQTYEGLDPITYRDPPPPDL